MSLSAEIWLNGAMFDPEGVVHEWARFDLPHYVTDVEALEDVFCALNDQQPRQPELESVRGNWYADGNRSLSVGDVVVLVRDLAPGEPSLRLPYRCANVGWESIPDPRIATPA